MGPLGCLLVAMFQDPGPLPCFSPASFPCASGKTLYSKWQQVEILGPYHGVQESWEESPLHY